MPSSPSNARVGLIPTQILWPNSRRSSYYIINQHAATAIWVSLGSSAGPHVTTAGNHMGERIGPNGGQIFDNNDKGEVFAVSTAVNNEVLVIESVDQPQQVQETKVTRQK